MCNQSAGKIGEKYLCDKDKIDQKDKDLQSTSELKLTTFPDNISISPAAMSTHFPSPKRAVLKSCPESIISLGLYKPCLNSAVSHPKSRKTGAPGFKKYFA